MANKPQKPVKREYTLMIVPHHGQGIKSLTIPMRYLQVALGLVSFLCLFYVGTLWAASYEVKVAEADKAELEQLRIMNQQYQQQLQDLTAQAVTLQEDVSRVQQLEIDVKNLLNSSQDNQTSRSGPIRVVPGGKGGPAREISVNGLSQALLELDQAAHNEQAVLAGLRDQLVQRQQLQAITPSIWPAPGEVTSRFGLRSSPFGSGSDFHPGIDIAGSYGDQIVATAEGTVVLAGWVSGYGNLVEIDHGNGIHTLYGHNQQMLVQAGQHVRKGEAISLMGSTGLSTGPHVHYEVQVNGAPVDPVQFLH